MKNSSNPHHRLCGPTHFQFRRTAQLSVVTLILGPIVLQLQCVSKTFSHPLLSSFSHCLRNSSHLRYWIRSLTVCLSSLHSAETLLKSCRNCLFSADTWHQFCCISDRSSMLYCASSSRYPTRAFKSVISPRYKHGGS
jgi:hypothetical protein